MTEAERKALAKASQNPVAKLISVPFENNFNGDFGPDNSNQNELNIKPVVPVKLNDNWNLINRLILPGNSDPHPYRRGVGQRELGRRSSGGVGRVFGIGKQHVNMKMAYYYNVEKPRFGAQWDLQCSLTFLFPK